MTLRALVDSWPPRARRRERLRAGGGVLLSFLAAILLALLPVFPAWGQTPETGTAAPLIINSLKIIGNQAIPAKELYNEMQTPRPHIFRWRQPPVFNAVELTNDIQRLQAAYRRAGFYQAEITTEIDEYLGAVNILLKVQEGPWIRVATIDLSVVDSPELRRTLPDFFKQSPLQVGGRFSEKGFENLKKAILNYLLDHGYPKARIEGEVLLDPAENTAAVYVQIWPGPLSSFGPLTVQGQQATPEALIRRALRFQKGEVFSLEKIVASQERLYELDLFRRVALTPTEVPEEETVIPVTVEVEEKKQRSLRLGAGYGSWDEFRARAVFRYRNLGGGGRVLEMSAKYSRLENRFEGSFLNPMLFGSDLDFICNAGYLRRYYPSFSDKAFYTRTLLQKEFADRTKIYVGHGSELARPFNITNLALELLRETEPGRLYSANMVVWGLTRDTIDNPADPQKGGQIYLLGEVAPRFISHQVQFVQSILEARHYLGLGLKDLVLAGRVKLGVIPPIQDTDQIPIFRRFFAGGPASMRAYRTYYLGPRDLAGNPLGGESVALANVEVRFPIYKEFRGVAFLDAGNVYYKIQNTDLGQLKYGAGFGLRYQTPIGPLGLEIAWPLNPINRETDKYQVIFNIGQSF